MKDDAVKKEKGKRVVRSASKEAAYLALSVALITVCAFITVPIGAVPVTLQTFAVALIGVLFGTARGTLAIVIYLVMGLVGIPVFSGFRAGVAALMGPTGGYMIGFVFEAAITGLFSLIPAKNKIAKTALVFFGAVLGLAVCYFFGTLWYIEVYNSGSADPVGVASALMLCVVPFLLPDTVKLFFAALLGVKLKKHINL